MKRQCEAVAPAIDAFFALDECVDILLSTVCCPLLVATLLRLCKRLRRGVWQTMADPRLCPLRWVRQFLKRLWSALQSPEMHMSVGSRMVCTPVFMAPCKHSKSDRFYVGQVGTVYWRGAREAFCALADDTETSDEDSDATVVEHRGASDLVAYMKYEGDHAIVHWQPVCCNDIALFRWVYVARALRDNIDRRIVAKNYNQMVLSRQTEWQYLFYV